MKRRVIFLTGGTGYIGRRLIPLLTSRGHTVRALIRVGSASRLPAGAEPIVGDALASETFARRVASADTFIQLVGVAHPSPGKATLFRSIDLVSVHESAKAASQNDVQHFIYVSVAQPAPVMREYVAVRAEGEAIVRATGMNATFLRPWYVLGPGHRWPWLLLPFYRLAEILPPLRATALRFHPVTLKQFLSALISAVENPPRGIRVIETAEMRRA